MIKQQKKIENLIKSLVKKNTSNKKVWINQSTSPLGLMNEETVRELKLQKNDSNWQLVIFVSSIKHSDGFTYYNDDKTILITNQYKNTHQIMRKSFSQESNRNTFLYISSISNLDYTKLDELYFLECVMSFLKEYTGRVILQFNPFFAKNFKQEFKNFKSYFQTSFDSQIQFLESSQNVDNYIVYSQIKEKIILEVSLTQLNQKEAQKKKLIQNGKKVFLDKNTTVLRNERLLIATDDVMTSYRNNQHFKFNQNNTQIEQNIKKIRDHFDYDFTHPEFQMVLSIYKEFGIILCELKNLAILKAKISQEFTDDEFQPNFDDSQFTEQYKNFQSALKRFIVKNPQMFPVIVTDSPLYFLIGRNFSFNYLEIEQNFGTQISYSQSEVIERLVHRQNNMSCQANSLYTFVKSEKINKIFDQLKNEKKEKDNCIIEYPLNLQKRCAKYMSSPKKKKKE